MMYMVNKTLPGVAWLTLIGMAGCATGLPERYATQPVVISSSVLVKDDPYPVVTNPAPDLIQVTYSSGDSPTQKKDQKFNNGDGKRLSPRVPTELSLTDLIKLTVERNPRLAQVGWAVETARGRAIQAKMYPNPTISITGDELGDRTGPGGIWTAPYFQQEIVTANKLGLSQAAALKEVDQAALAVVCERYRLFTNVRKTYFELVTLQERVEILEKLVELAEKSVENANKLLKAKEGSELDVVQLEVDLERYKADLEATNKALPATFRRLAASVGMDDLPYGKVGGGLETPLPEYELERIRTYILGIHPALRSAQIGVERAKLVVQRVTVESIPNVTLGTGYVRQNQNKSNDWVINASIPVPLWNKNEGNIFAAKAQVEEALNEVGRVQNDLVGRLATAYTTFIAAKERVERYRIAIIPKAEQSYHLALKGQKGGEFEYLRVLQSQRAVAETRLEYLRSLGEAWQSASEIAGFMLEDQWPVLPSK
ncbi:MAG: TolC family protein [Zavarzinella sp.]